MSLATDCQLADTEPRRATAGCGNNVANRVANVNTGLSEERQFKLGSPLCIFILIVCPWRNKILEAIYTKFLSEGGSCIKCLCVGGGEVRGAVMRRPG